MPDILSGSLPGGGWNIPDPDKSLDEKNKDISRRNLDDQSNVF